MSGSSLPFAAALAAFLASAGSVFFWRRALTGPHWTDAPRPDRHHLQPASRTGGVAWLTGALTGLGIGVSLEAGAPAGGADSVGRVPVALVAGGLLLAFLLGLADDRGRMGPGRKLLLQTILLVGSWILLRGPAEPWSAGAVGAMGGETLVRVAGALVLALLLQTALGIFDNMDAALALVSASALASAWALAEAPGLRLAAAAGCGATLGFLIWNRPPARVFLGNCGSQPVALLISLLVLLLLSGHAAGHVSEAPARLAASATPTPGTWAARPWLVLLPLVWPLFDLFFVTVTRVRGGRKPWHGGRDHTTHRLARRLGSDRAASGGILLAAGISLILVLMLRGAR